MSTWTELTCYSLFSLIRLPAWDTLLHTHTHSTSACRTCSPTPGLQSLTRLLAYTSSVSLVALSHGGRPAVLDPARHPAIISIYVVKPRGLASVCHWV